MNLDLPLSNDDPTTYWIKHSNLVNQYLTIYNAAVKDGIIALDPKVMQEFIYKYCGSSWYITRGK
jgi:hypothetical protein